MLIRSFTLFAAAIIGLSSQAAFAAATLYSVNPLSDTVKGGRTRPYRLMLTQPAETDLVVTLSSSSPSVPVPASVTVLAGSSFAIFDVTPLPVATPIIATLTGSAGGETRSATLHVNPPALVVMRLGTDSAPGGRLVQWNKVYLDAPAPVGGAVVALTSNHAGVVVPATVTIPAGQTDVYFTFTTQSVAAAAAVTVQASYAGSVQTASVTVNPAALLSVSPSLVTAVGGTTAGFTATLSGAAGPGGAVVNVQSSHAAVTPFSFTIPAGATQGVFSVTPAAVSSMISAALTATSGGGSAGATLLINAPSLAGSDVSPATVPQGGTGTWTIRLSGPAPSGGVAVSLSSSLAGLNVPPIVTIPAGSTSVAVTINAAGAGGSPNASLTAASGGVSSSSIVQFETAAYQFLVAPSSDTTVGGRTRPYRISISPAAPAGGVVFSLSSSNTAALQVPASVTIPAGQIFVLFEATSTPVAAPTPVTITAQSGGQTNTGLLTVNPASLTLVRLTSEAILGGKPVVQNKVYLDGMAPAAGAVVALHSSAAAAQAPASVTVPGGQSDAFFDLNTAAVTAQIPVTITASLGSSSKNTGLMVNPPLGLGGVSPESQSVLPGGAAIYTVSLNQPAPAGGAVVQLASSHAAVTVPPSVAIAAGTVSANFTAGGQSVAAVTTAVLTATFAGGSKTASLTVNPTPKISSLGPGSTSVTAGAPVVYTVGLTQPALAGGYLVTLASSHAVAPVPTAVTVPVGQTQTTFTVNTVFTASPASSLITASADGLSQTATLTVNPPANFLSQMKTSTTVVVGGVMVTGTATLNAPAPAGGAVVTLASSLPGAASTPASVSVPAGSTAVSFSVPTTAVSLGTPVTISGSYGGSTQTTVLNVNPAVYITTLGPASSTIVGGRSGLFRITLNTTTPTDYVVNLSSSDPTVTLPPTVTIAAGLSTVLINPATVPVASPISSNIRVSAYNVSQTSVLNVNPAALALVSMVTTTITGGKTILQNKIYLEANAPAGGTVVTLSSSDPAVVPPATVTILAGKSDVVFDVVTKVVPAQVAATMLVSREGVTKTVNLTVNPMLIASLTLQRTGVGGGATMTANSVTLNDTAGPGGVTIPLQSSNPGVAGVPASITFNAGVSKVNFNVLTTLVPVSSPATITATFNGGSKSIGLSVDPIQVESLFLFETGLLPTEGFYPTSLVGGLTGNYLNRVILNGPAPPGGMTVTMWTSDTSKATIQPSVVIPAGQTFVRGFAFATQPVTTPTPVTSYASHNGIAASNALTLLPLPQASGTLRSDVKVYVGYADLNHHTGPVLSPYTPLYLHDANPNHIMVMNGKPPQFDLDAGVIRVDNNGTSTLYVDKVTFVGNGGAGPEWNLWGSFTVPPGGKAILSQTSKYDFDVSDYSFLQGNYVKLCGAPSTPCPETYPLVKVRLAGEPEVTLVDSGHVLDGGNFGYDPYPNNESSQWRLIGTTATVTHPAGQPD